VRQKGVYLITGGMGGMGWRLAQYLAQTVKAKLVLVGRSVDCLPKEQWGAMTGQLTILKRYTDLESAGVEALQAESFGNYLQCRCLQSPRQIRKRRSFWSLNAVKCIVIHAARLRVHGMIQLKSTKGHPGCFKLSCSEI